MRFCPFVIVLGNEIPFGFKAKFVNAEQIQKPEGAYHFPRIGSFEVYYKGNIVFSKLATLKWPHPNSVAERVQQLDQELKSKALQQSKLSSQPLTKTKKYRKKSKSRTKSRKRRGVLRPNARLYSPPAKIRPHKVKSQLKPTSYAPKPVNNYQNEYYAFEKNNVFQGSDTDSKEDFHSSYQNHRTSEYPTYDIQPTVSDYKPTSEVQHQFSYHDFSRNAEVQMLDIEEPVVHSHLLEREGPLQHIDSEDYENSQENMHKIDQASEKYDKLTKDDSYLSNLPESKTNPFQKVQLIKIPTNSEYSHDQDYEGTYEFGSARKTSNSYSSSEHPARNHKKDSSYEHYDKESYEEDQIHHSQYSRSSSESAPALQNAFHSNEFNDSHSQEHEFSESSSSSSSEEEQNHPLREVTKSYNVSLPTGSWTKKVTFT